MSYNVISAEIKGIRLELKTHPALFSPRAVDGGTLAMLRAARFSPQDKVLDLGCGYGPVGILAAKLIGEDRVVMCDRDPLAVLLAKENAAANGVSGIKTVVSDAFSGIDDRDFTLILSNPPYNADFSVPKAFIEKGFNRLIVGGRLLMVTKRRDWYKNKLTSIFGGVRITEDDGYFIFTAEKRSLSYAKKN